MKKYTVLLTIVCLAALALPAFGQAHRQMTLIRAGSYVAGENSTTNLAAGTRVDVPLWVNLDGSYPTIPVLLTGVGTNAIATNVVTFTFASLPDGTNELATASVAMTLTGTTTKVIVTNISSVLTLTGVKSLKLKTIAVDDTAADQGNLTVTAKVLGFVP